MRRILLHTCCGPCTTYVYQHLRENEFEIKGLFYNPNIRPQAEYERRLLTMEHYATVVGLKVIYEANDVQIEQADCAACYRVRLTKTAQKAQESGYDYFSTTLLISPYQKIKLIKQIGEEIGRESGVEFLCRDFRIGYRTSRQMAREMKLYMQKYCGCKEASYVAVA
ncbi:hypothetical protein A3H38_00640 [candidate division WOR-1 bacterium RIFCSPLOWO2_02_FULL_46_20]|uniref:Epoxyqueuosine reductase QueH n=2 Tax=Saganbacteria TaxID=1703751 RepID=A0A1F4RGY0_UNCSA|nr:MAG: hypothetical protein A3J44_03900 [candidate division WOR-1 bacterium RIFCSPHIGHO2_02_FULL_45_12]OGC07420.1 MAG: hypothetical protein A3H38_00640 [candidate division WOR-1 bacterium RIFCSPLOWO2_02_FULL_46_20]OGC07887.1 MAG: hypothetical protein A3F86_03085 [candidate division WOR-1 bacterium RIFCSPLOWO2_12_FULL_45_9]